MRYGTCVRTGCLTRLGHGDKAIRVQSEYFRFPYVLGNVFREHRHSQMRRDVSGLLCGSVLKKASSSGFYEFFILPLTHERSRSHWGTTSGGNQPFIFPRGGGPHSSTKGEGRWKEGRYWERLSFPALSGEDGDAATSIGCATWDLGKKRLFHWLLGEPYVSKKRTGFRVRKIATQTRHAAESPPRKGKVGGR